MSARRFHDLGNRVIVAGRRRAALEEMIVTNPLGPIRLIDAFVDHLRTRENAVLVNVSSGLAFVPSAYTPTYSATKAAIRSHTVSLRDRLKGRVEVIELAPPGVRTEPTSGRSKREGHMPLETLVEEVTGLFQTVPTPTEIVVKNRLFPRNAEAEGRFDAAANAVNRGRERSLTGERRKKDEDRGLPVPVQSGALTKASKPDTKRPKLGEVFPTGSICRETFLATSIFGIYPIIA